MNKEELREEKSTEMPGVNPESAMFPISVVANILQVHQRTLRIYDDEKLLIPYRSPKNRRLYSVKDIEKGKFIQYLTRELGINLAGIKIIFHLLSQLNVASAEYINHVNEIAKELNISAEMQELNKERFSKRGRKPGSNK